MTQLFIMWFQLHGASGSQFPLRNNVTCKCERQVAIRVFTLTLAESENICLINRQKEGESLSKLTQTCLQLNSLLGQLLLLHSRV